MSEEILRRFGESLGLPGLAFSPRGVCVLEIEQLGQLRFERLGEAIYLCLARPFPPHDEDLPERVLKILARPGPAEVRPGLYGENTLILAVRFTSGDFTLAGLEGRLDFLREIMEETARSA